jgi:hypothetical protein
MVRLRGFAACVAVGIPATACGQAPPAGSTAPGAARDAIVAAFADHRVVFVGEHHWNIAMHEFLRGLLNDRRLPGLVTDIAVEFGNSRYQPIVDRFIEGQPVPEDSLRLVWQNTTVPMAWDSPVYEQFYREIRRINQSLPAERRFRVLALDPPVDWAEVRTPDDFPRGYGYRDPDWFMVLEREVLSRNRRALVIAGAVHMLRRDPSSGFTARPMDRAGIGEALAQRYPGMSYNVWPLIGRSALVASVPGWRPGELLDLAGSPIGANGLHDLMPGSVQVRRMVNGRQEWVKLEREEYPPIGQIVDALLYIGPDTSLAQPGPGVYRDAGYLAELRRRADIVTPAFGLDLSPRLDSLLAALEHGGRTGLP